MNPYISNAEVGVVGVPKAEMLFVESCGAVELIAQEHSGAEESCTQLLILKPHKAGNNGAYRYVKYN